MKKELNWNFIHRERAERKRYRKNGIHNFITAVGSGKRFRRSGFYLNFWCHVKDGEIISSHGTLPRITQEDILAHDWEIENYSTAEVLEKDVKE